MSFANNGLKYWEKNDNNEIITTFLTKIDFIMKEVDWQRVDKTLHFHHSCEYSFNEDPTWKMADLISMVNTNFLKYYQPGEYLNLDEKAHPFVKCCKVPCF